MGNFRNCFDIILCQLDLDEVGASPSKVAGGARKRVKSVSSINAQVLTTFQVPDVIMVGMCVGRFRGDFFAVNSRRRQIVQFELTERVRMVQRYGGERSLKQPLDVDQLPDGRIVVTDGKAGHCVKIFAPGNDQVIAVVAESLLKKAVGVTTTQDGNILVTDVDDQSIFCLRPEKKGGFGLKYKIKEHKGKNQFESPQYIACNSSGKVIVSDRMRSSVKTFNGDNGHFMFMYGRWGDKSNMMKKPEGVCFDAEGRLYIMDVDNGRIHILSQRGNLIGHIHIGPVCGRFEPTPSMLASTPRGNIVVGNLKGWVKILKVSITKEVTGGGGSLQARAGGGGGFQASGGSVLH